MKHQYISAAEARKLTDTTTDIDGPFKRTETIEILQSIRAAAERGNCSVTTEHTDKIIVARLAKLGYKVVRTADQRDGTFLTITW